MNEAIKRFYVAITIKQCTLLSSFVGYYLMIAALNICRMKYNYMYSHNIDSTKYNHKILYMQRA